MDTLGSGHWDEQRVQCKRPQTELTIPRSRVVRIEHVSRACKPEGIIPR